MSSRPKQAIRRQDNIASRKAEVFEADALSNAVHEDLYQDEQLAQLLDATAEADRAEDMRANDLGDDADRLEDVRHAWGFLSDVASGRAAEVIAEACVTVIQDGDEWAESDSWTQSQVDAAKHEAREWLQIHSNAAVRAGVFEEVSN